MAIFSTYPVKTPPAGADQVMIADSADGGACKLVAISDLIIAAAENVLYVMVDDTLLADDPDNLRFMTFDAAVVEVNLNYATYPTIVMLIGGAGPYSWTIDFAVANPRLSLVKIADVSNPTVVYSGGTMSDFPFDLLTVDLQITVPGAALVMLHVTDPRSSSTISFDGDVADTVQFHELYGQYFQIVGDLGAVDVRVIGFDNDVVVGNLIVSNIGFVDLGVFADGALATTRAFSIDHLDTADIDVLRINAQNSVIKESVISAGLLVFGGADLDLTTRGIRNATINIQYTVTKIDRDTCTAPYVLDAYAMEYPYATLGIITLDGMQNCNINFESIDFSGVTAPTAFEFWSIFSQRDSLSKTSHIINSSIRVGVLAGLSSFTPANFTGFAAGALIWDNDNGADYNTKSNIIRSTIHLNLSESLSSDNFSDTLASSDIFPGNGFDMFGLYAENSVIELPIMGAKIDTNPTTITIFPAIDGTTGLENTKLNIGTLCFEDSDGAGGKTGSVRVANTNNQTGLEILVDYLRGSSAAPTLANDYNIDFRNSTSINRFYTTGAKEVFTIDVGGSFFANFKFPGTLTFPCYLNLADGSSSTVTVNGGGFDTVDIDSVNSNFYGLRIGTLLDLYGSYNTIHVSECADVTFETGSSENKVYGCVSRTITDVDGLGILGSGNVVVDDVLKQATIVRNLFLAGQ